MPAKNSIKGVKIYSGQVIRGMTLLYTLPVSSKGHFWVVRCEDGTEKQVRNESLKHYTLAKEHCGPEVSVTNQIGTEYKRSARLRGYDFNLNPEQFSKLLTSDCEYCGSKPKTLRYARGSSGIGIYHGGIDRVNNSIGYTEENCVSCCSTCNFAKNDLSYDEFMSWIMQITKHQVNKKRKEKQNDRSIETQNQTRVQ